MTQISWETMKRMIRKSFNLVVADEDLGMDGGDFGGIPHASIPVLSQLNSETPKDPPLQFCHNLIACYSSA